MSATNIIEYTNGFVPDSDDLYLDNSRLTTQLDDYGYSADLLNISDVIFVGRDNVLGTEGLELLYRQQQEIANLSNMYKTRVANGVLPTLQSAQSSTNLVAEVAGDSISLGVFD